MDIFLWNEPQENIKNEIIFNNLKSWTRDYIFQPLFSSNYGDNFIYLAENLINTYWLKLSTDFTSFFLKKYSISLIVSCYIFVDSNSSIDAGFFIYFSITLFVFYPVFCISLFYFKLRWATMIKFSTLFFLILKYDLCIQCTVYSLDRKKKLERNLSFGGFF